VSKLLRLGEIKKEKNACVFKPRLSPIRFHCIVISENFAFAKPKLKKEQSPGVVYFLSPVGREMGLGGT
jgi:hypothetical protein